MTFPNVDIVSSDWPYLTQSGLIAQINVIINAKRSFYPNVHIENSVDQCISTFLMEW